MSPSRGVGCEQDIGTNNYFEKVYRPLNQPLYWPKTPKKSCNNLQKSGLNNFDKIFVKNRPGVLYNMVYNPFIPQKSMSPSALHMSWYEKHWNYRFLQTFISSVQTTYFSNIFTKHVFLEQDIYTRNYFEHL